MLKHNFFEELCALAATGQLSSEEASQLKEHLVECVSCREVQEEFAGILHELPRARDARIDRRALHGTDMKKFRHRFLDRAPSEGHRFSPEAQQSIIGRSWAFPEFLGAYQLAVAGLLVGTFVIGILMGARGYRALRASHQELRAAAIMPPAPSEQAYSRTVANDEHSPSPMKTPVPDETSQKTIASLRAENEALGARLGEMEKRFNASGLENQNLHQDLTQAVARVGNLNAQFAAQMEQNAQVLLQTKSELEKSNRDREAMAAELSAQKTEAAVLLQQVRLQNTSMDQDRQLLAAGRDITDLMGARNLHMMDVRDADSTGKDRKSFGRVFFTEGKSLIFYAFDLDDKKLVDAKYQFEAWGERLGQPSSVKSLGMLYADDKVQRRWVLKVDDPRQIAQIDSVFVTLEPHGGESPTPRGKKILYAFLGAPPNHP